MIPACYLYQFTLFLYWHYALTSRPLHQSLLKQVFIVLLSFKVEWLSYAFLLYWCGWHRQKQNELLCVYLSVTKASELGWPGSCIWTWQAGPCHINPKKLIPDWFLVQLVYSEEILRVSVSGWSVFGTADYVGGLLIGLFLKNSSLDRFDTGTLLDVKANKFSYILERLLLSHAVLKFISRTLVIRKSYRTMLPLNSCAVG